MTDLSGTLRVFGIALGAALLVMAVHRFVLPRLGIALGTEKLTRGGKK